VAAGVVHGQHHHARGRSLARRSLRDLDAVHAGHGDVEERDVGLGLQHGIERGAAVAHLADDLEPRKSFEQRANARANQGVIIGQQDAHESSPLRGTVARRRPFGIA
jgi:hypothetical protein